MTRSGGTVVAVARVVALGLIVSGVACLPLQLGAALLKNPNSNSEQADARMRAQSERTRQAARADEGREDWPCPPECLLGFSCVHIEKVDRAVCRPVCDADHGCDAGSTCIALTPRDAVCLDPIFVDGARIEPLKDGPAPPAALEGTD